ncbi:MAG: SRPBCC domain-containing protein [Chitinophagaceae bacterium]
MCKINEAVPMQKLSYTWRYIDLPGNTLVIFELFHEEQKTKARLTHQGLETFPQDQPDFRRQSFENGWTEIIGKNLKAFLEKK